MSNSVTEFMDKAKVLTRNPLGIIALFVSLIYGFACLVFSIGFKNLSGHLERLPLIWFLILFPLLILGTFTYLVIKHHKKLYGPGDYKDEKNFTYTFIGNKDFGTDLENINNQIKILKKSNIGEQIENSLTKISTDIEKLKEKSEKIPINNLWRLNHWHSDCASIIGNKMIFKGTIAPKGEDGSHIDVNNMLEIGKTYEISCFAKAEANTTGEFQLWCHDKTGVTPNGASERTTYKTPSIEGEKIKLIFEAKYNKNIRIHLQYNPGEGQIEVSDIRISEIKG